MTSKMDLVSLRLTLTSLMILAWLTVSSHAFVSVPSTSGLIAPIGQPFPTPHQQHRFQRAIYASSSTIGNNGSDQIQTLLNDAEERMIQSNGKIDINDLEPYIERIENVNAYSEPNRSPTYKGQWYTWYTNCPPPSNGQLGPFQGSSEQEIPSQGNSYDNILRLPPNSKDSWLSVTLEGIWEDWNGIMLDADESTDGNKVNDSQDWGANYWKVTFKRLNFRLFGNKVFTQDFPPNVARVWRTTYLDDETGTRIVRAGQTGRTDDEYVFYLKRTPRPTSS